MMVKRLLTSVLLLIVLLAAPGVANAGWVALAWDENSPADEVTGYKIHWGTQTGVYPNTEDVGNVTRCFIASLPDGVTLYFVATAYNKYAESEYSNEVSGIANPDPPPAAGVPTIPTNLIIKANP